MNQRQILAPEEYHYTQEEKIRMVALSARANKVCKGERKAFNLCRGNVVGKFVDPLQCKDQAISLINCFQGVSQVAPPCQSAFQQSLACLAQEGAQCSEQLSAFQTC